MKILFLYIVILSPNLVIAQPLISRLYLKGNVGMHLNFSFNNSATSTPYGIEPNGSNEKTSIGVGKYYDIGLGCDLGKGYFLETGYGIYPIVLTYHIQEYGTFTVDAYKNVKVVYQYNQIAIRLGRWYTLGEKLKIAPYLGGNMLVDAIRNKTNPYAYQALQKRRGNPYDGYYEGGVNTATVFAMLFSPGVAIEYPVSNKLSIQSAVNITMSFRTIADGGIVAYQERSPFTVSSYVFSTTQGMGFGLNLGVKYSPFKKSAGRY